MFRKLATAACATLLISCMDYSLDNPSANHSPTPIPASQLPEVEAITLPESVAAHVKATYADEQNISVEQVNILRFSREIWSDGCLGLGDPAELCLLTLTEGWQVEAVDPTTRGNSQFYRTDLTGGQIRLSKLENNLPPSVGDRILQTLRVKGMAQDNELSIVSAEPQVWDSCLGVADEDEICAAIGILGWKATATDTQSSWTYHTDGLGNAIVLHSASEALRGTIPPALRPPDETDHSSEINVDDFS